MHSHIKYKFDFCILRQIECIVYAFCRDKYNFDIHDIQLSTIVCLNWVKHSNISLTSYAQHAHVFYSIE